MICVNIGLGYYYLGQFKEAINYYEKALEIYHAIYDAENEEYAYVYSNIGAAYSEDDKLEKAIPNYIQAIDVLEKVYQGEKNLDLAQAYSEIADAYVRLGMFDETSEKLDKCFTMYDGLVSQNSYRYIQPYSTLGTLFEALGDYESAEVQYRHVIQLLLKNEYSEDSPYVVQYTDKIREIKEKRECESKNDC